MNHIFHAYELKQIVNSSTKRQCKQVSAKVCGINECDMKELQRGVNLKIDTQ